jgi:hypothetical protein
MALMDDIYAQNDRKKAPRTNVVAGLSCRRRHCCRAWKFKERLSVAVKFTSRILEGLMAWRGFVEPREEVG